MKVGIASDHRGYLLKEQILKDMPELIDFGTSSTESTDYPLFAIKIGEAVKNKIIDYGVLICGSGIGMSIACNKVKGVRCAKIENEEEAEITRRDNDANVISFSEKHDVNEATRMINTFLTTPFNTEEKYKRRLNQIKEYEETW